MEKTKKSHGFRNFLVVYSTLMILLIVFGLYYVWNLLIDYEAGMPDVNMDKYLIQFEWGEIGKLLDEYDVTVNEYDNTGNIVLLYNDFISGKKLSYQKVNGKYTNATPVYGVYADDVQIAEVELSETGKNGHGFSVWEISNVTFDGYGPERYSVSIRVPGNCSVMVNGREVSDDYLVETKEVDCVKNVKEYISWVPDYKVYKIDNFIKMPDVKVNGEHAVPVSSEEYTVCYDYGTDEALLNELKNRIWGMAHEYGAYIINKGSLGNLKTYMIGKAREYVSDIPAIWAYLVGQEYTYTFTDEKLENFVRYSDDCASCDVSYKLNVSYSGRSITYDTAFGCTYIRKDGNWYLADFVLR